MSKMLKYNCIKELKKSDLPLIIVAAVGESEAVLNACKNNQIEVTAFCDSIKGKSENLFCGIPIIHTPSLSKSFPKAKFIIASHLKQLYLLRKVKYIYNHNHY